MEKVKVALWGLGAMGSDIARVLLQKEGVEITGVCDTHPLRQGRSLGELLGISEEACSPSQRELRVVKAIDEAVGPKSCDICVIAVTSFVRELFDKAAAIMNKGINVITIAEEMAYPWAKEPELSKALDETARKNGVSILGTGINPGMAMDLLAIFLSGAMTRVDSVTCQRINSLSPFGVTVMEEQGIGLTPEEFEDGAKNGRIAGHVGFAESVRMISDTIGLGIDCFEQEMSPILTDVDRQAPHGAAKAGQVAGVRMAGRGLRQGEVIIDMLHPQQIAPEAAGAETGDYITLSGLPEIKMSIRPEISGGYGTVAMCVNCIPHVINARPGLRTMAELPVPHAIMKDFRSCIDPERKIVK